jgi:hypothetical protein
MEIVKVMSTITEAELVLAQVTIARERAKPRVIGFDLYYQLLLERAHLPGNTSKFPNRVLTRELLADMIEQVADLRFSALERVGHYFGQAHFQELGVAPWRHMTGNGWQFPRLSVLRQAWELQHGGWQWPNALTDWIWNPKLLKR